jgi:hypothetical protein
LCRWRSRIFIVAELKPWRLSLVFSFGLLHGMGFAGVWRDLGLRRARFMAALVSFNVGVEAGQLTTVPGAFIALAYWQRSRTTYRRLIVQPAHPARSRSSGCSGRYSGRR